MTPAVRYQWWRWPLVPIAAFAAAIGAKVIFYWINWLSMMMIFGSTDGWLMRYVVPAMGLSIGGYAFTLAVQFTAPSKKDAAGAVMAALLMLIAAFGILLSWVAPDQTVVNSIAGTVGLIALAASAITAVVQRWSSKSTLSAG